MPASKVAISIDSVLLAEVDGLVEREEFASRSQAIQTAVREKLARMRRSRLAEECAKLDPSMEKDHDCGPQGDRACAVSAVINPGGVWPCSKAVTFSSVCSEIARIAVSVK